MILISSFELGSGTACGSLPRMDLYCSLWGTVHALAAFYHNPNKMTCAPAVVAPTRLRSSRCAWHKKKNPLNFFSVLSCFDSTVVECISQMRHDTQTMMTMSTLVVGNGTWLLVRAAEGVGFEYNSHVDVNTQSPFLPLYPLPVHRWAKTLAKKTILSWPGIEPGSPAWQAEIIPLNHQDITTWRYLLLSACEYFTISTTNNFNTRWLLFFAASSPTPRSLFAVHLINSHNRIVLYVCFGTRGWNEHNTNQPKTNPWDTMLSEGAISVGCLLDCYGPFLVNPCIDLRYSYLSHVHTHSLSLSLMLHCLWFLHVCIHVSASVWGIYNPGKRIRGVYCDAENAVLPK